MRKLWGVLWVVFSFNIGMLKAETVIDIVGGSVAKQPISVAYFYAEDQLPKAFTEVIRNDLLMTGDFNLIAPPNQERPANLQQFNPNTWRPLGIHALAIGQIQALGANKVRISFQLINPVNSQIMTEGGFETDWVHSRAVAHKIADQIYQTLQGGRSFFDSQIVFVVKRAGAYLLQVADVDGAGAQTLLQSKAPIISPRLSPNGQELAYVSFEPNKAVVYIQNLKTGQRRLVANFKGSNSAPAWSPDGKSLLVSLSQSGLSQIYRINAAGNSPPIRVSRSDGIDTEASFHPSGQSIAYTSDRSGSPQIYLQSLQSGEVKRLSFQGAYNVSPQFSKDGRFLSYLRKEAGRFKIMNYDLMAQSERSIASDAYVESASFAPNSKMILYAAKEGGRSALYAVNLDGTYKIRLALIQGEIQDPTWGPFNP